MNKNESAKCFNEQIRKRWPRWTVSDVEISDWLVWLEAFDYPTIATAARMHLAESRYAKPIPSELLGHAKKLAPKPSPKQAKKKSSGIPEEHTFIMCVATGENGCGNVGWFVPILIWPFHKTYTAETYRRIAEEQCVMHSRNGRAGIWEIFTNTTHGEMVTRRMKLQGTKPLDLNELRKHYKNRQRAGGSRQKHQAEATR